MELSSFSINFFLYILLYFRKQNPEKAFYISENVTFKPKLKKLKIHPPPPTSPQKSSDIPVN